MKNFDENSYKPLPAGLTIKESSIDGLGLFATKDWDAGEEIGISHVLCKGLHHDIDEWIRTPLGGFINHSDNPNCFMVYERIMQTHPGAKFQWTRRAYSVKPIKDGEEVTAYYTLDQSVLPAGFIKEL